MKVTATLPWNVSYGEGTWIGTPIFQGRNRVGEVVDEEWECKRTCCVTLEIDSGVILEGAEHMKGFELDIIQALQIYAEKDEDDAGE